MPSSKEIGKEIFVLENEVRNLQERIITLRHQHDDQLRTENREVLWQVTRRIDGEVLFGPASYDRVCRFISDVLGADHMQPSLPDERGSFIFTTLNKQVATHFMERAV